LSRFGGNLGRKRIPHISPFREISTTSASFRFAFAEIRLSGPARSRRLARRTQPARTPPAAASARGRRRSENPIVADIPFSRKPLPENFAEGRIL
jgi:hypothetical protein